MKNLKRKIGVVFEDVSCEEAASIALTAGVTWGGVSAIFVDRNCNAIAMACNTVECEKEMKANFDNLVGVYHWGRLGKKEPAFKALVKSVGEDIFMHIKSAGV